MKTLLPTAFGLWFCVVPTRGQTPPRAPITAEMVRKAKFYISTGSLGGVDMAVMDYQFAVNECEQKLGDVLNNPVGDDQGPADEVLKVSAAEARLIHLQWAYGTLVSYKWRLGKEKSAPTCLSLGQRFLQPAIEAQIKGLDRPDYETIRTMTLEELKQAITFEGWFMRDVEGLAVLYGFPFWVPPRLNMWPLADKSAIDKLF